MDLEGRVAIVTGAAIGLGRALAMELSTRGMRVAALDINGEGLRETIEQVRDMGGEASLCHTNLMEASEIEQAVHTISERWGGVDVVANVAGIWRDERRALIGKQLQEIPVSEIDAMIAVNLRAPILLSRACIPGMIDQRGGKIINISGSFPEGGFGQVPYYVSKKAVELFTEAVAPELRKHNVQINCISPGDFRSEWFETLVPEYLSTCISMQDITRLVTFLLENPAAGQITGQVIGIGDHWTQWDVGQGE